MTAFKGRFKRGRGMDSLPAKPDGSAISEKEEFEGTSLSWPLPPLAFRYVALPFLFIWTFAWAIGLLSVLHSLILSPDIVLFLWLVGWIAAGGWGPIVVWASLRSRPESVLLGHGSLTYDPGWELDSPSILAGLMSGTLPLSPRKPIVVPRNCRFELEPVGEHHRLSFEHEGERIAVGADLGEQDREWLYGVLQNWRRD
jgi:hypothetical protein